MAVRANPAFPTSGYFWTDDFEVVVDFVINYLAQYRHSINFVCHASSIFIKDGEEREIHMEPCAPIILDPNMYDIRNRVELCFDIMNDPENWVGLDGSGWAICPNTMNYWFKIIAYQPNAPPEENDRNRWDPPDYDHDDSQPTPSFPEYDSFYLSIAAHFVDNPGRLSKIRLVNKYNRWLESERIFPNFYSATKIYPAMLPQLHNQLRRFSLRIWSEYGNVIYEKKYNMEYINILWANRKFKYIKSLSALLKEKSDRQYCNLCKRMHKGSCKQHIEPAPTEHIEVPEYPEGRHALVTYADFESIVLPNNEHAPSGYGLITIDKEKNKIYQYVRNAIETDNVLEKFIYNLFYIAEKWALDTIQYQMMVPGGVGDLILSGIGAAIAASKLAQTISKKLKRTYFCQICDEEVSDLEQYVVGVNFINGLHGRHHKECWEDHKNSMVTYFHNFRGYDSHYVLQELMRDSRFKVTFLRGKSMEKFDIIHASTKSKDGHMIQITFKDTFNYLGTSIAKLVKQVQSWKYTPEKDRNSKGTFPYRWFDDVEKLRSRSLPPKEDWFNDITQSYVDPAPAIEIWNRENFRTFSEFHNYYMLTDVLQLADIFEEFRNTCLSQFNLDPIYFQGAPSFSWQLNLKINSDNMFLIKNAEIYNDIQANIRGGIAQCMHRYMETKDNETILFLDVNSLYSKCMTYKLPTKFLGRLDNLPENWMDLYDDGDECALLCVDLHYPKKYHDLHIAYPLAPHKFNGRLCTTFLDKKKYLVHSKVLKFYVKEGLEITHFYYGYIFAQDAVLKNYVNSNIDKRRATESTPLKTLYKLLNNSLYGKTCENKYKYRKFEVYKEDNSIFGKINTFLMDAKNWLPINDEVLVEKSIKKVVLDKPIQLGFSVLEFAKLEIYKFLFLIQEMMPQTEITPLYTDTDSIMIHFKHPHPEEIMYNNPEIRQYLDFDEVPEHWNVKTPGTLKQSGLWALETTDKILEFIGIRAKTYCYRTDKTTILKNKGITSTAVEVESKQSLTMEHYRKVLFDNLEVRVQQNTIGSKKHKIITRKQTKLALSNNDEKRFICSDKITTIPFGYKGEKFKEYIILYPELADHFDPVYGLIPRD